MSAKQALGRGLKALIPETPRARAGFAEIPVDRLRPNPQQPRHRFDDEALAELAESIRQHGVLQPILVSEDQPGNYLLLAEFFPESSQGENPVISRRYLRVGEIARYEFYDYQVEW